MLAHPSLQLWAFAESRQRGRRRQGAGQEGGSPTDVSPRRRARGQLCRAHGHRVWDGDELAVALVVALRAVRARPEVGSMGRLLENGNSGWHGRHGFSAAAAALRNVEFRVGEGARVTNAGKILSSLKIDKIR